MTKEPLISIVVPTLNQGEFIEQTLASIAGQCWPNLEVIVIDGGSTDGTASIVERYRHIVTEFVSEADSGQANAINKGFRVAKGTVMAWLNSDDYYLPLALRHAVDALRDCTQPRLAYGGCLVFRQSQPEARACPAKPPFDCDALKTRDFIYQPSTFWTRALWERTGPLNESLHFTLDWEWWLRACEHGEFIPVEEYLSAYRLHPRHKSGSANPKRVEEILALVDHYATPEWRAAFHEVAQIVEPFTKNLERLQQLGLFRFRTWVHRGLYKRHGGKVKVALSQLRSV